MSESLWFKQEETLSLKQACSEYGLTEKQILDAIHDGKLQHRVNYAHGNPYYRLPRVEVEALVQELLGAKGANEQAVNHQLATLNKEINSLKRKLTALEKQRNQLLQKQSDEKT